MARIIIHAKRTFKLIELFLLGKVPEQLSPVSLELAISKSAQGTFLVCKASLTKLGNYANEP